MQDRVLQSKYLPYKSVEFAVQRTLHNRSFATRERTSRFLFLLFYSSKFLLHFLRLTLRYIIVKSSARYAKTLNSYRNELRVLYLKLD